MYINDIHVGTSLNSTVKLFADDCILYREIRHNDDAQLLQYDFKKLYLWTQQWQLKLNVSKCKVMRITKKKIFISFDYRLNDLSLEWVNTFKFLGIKITPSLSWSKHILEVSSKVTSLLNLLRRNMSGCSKQAKSRAYVALVRPQLENSVPVWSPYDNVSCDSIEKAQKRAARWICAKWDKDSFQWSHSYDDCCLELGWQTLRQRRNLLICCQLYKMVNHLDCLVFEDYYSFNTSITRSHRYCINLLQSRVNVYRYSFFVNAPFLWNALPLHVVLSGSYHSFKSKLKQIL